MAETNATKTLQPPLLTLFEASLELRVPVIRVRKAVLAGLVPAFKLPTTNGPYLLSRESVEHLRSLWAGDDAGAIR